jgi:TRAP-type C4-dicarboxylate transport system substrate-binding protein
MRAAVRDAVVFQRELAIAEEEEAKRAILAEGCEIVEITPAEHERFASVVEPVLAGFRRTYGEEIFAMVPKA